eukprot:3969990-Pyramimonas_sp.AAC.1
MRRLTWYQAWSKYPEQHSGVLAAVFGDSRLDQLRQTPRTTPDKYAWPPGSAGQSTPWASSFESMSAWYNARASDLDIFWPGTEAHDRWPLVGPHALGNTKKRRK